MNPFGSEFFFWVDIGCVRDSSVLSKISTFPNQNKIDLLPRDKLVLTSIKGTDKCPHPLDSEGYYIYQSRHDWIEGGFFGGHISVWPQWVEEYETVLERYKRKYRPAGQDQVIMCSLALKRPELVHVRVASFAHGDVWFAFLQEFA